VADPTPGADLREMGTRALARVRDEQFADMLLLAFGVAAETHPEVLRALMAKVFDLSGVEQDTRQMLATVGEVRQQCLELYHLIAAVRKDFEALESRIERAEHRHRRPA
jgi:hypothetical protein